MMESAGAVVTTAYGRRLNQRYLATGIRVRTP